MSSRLMSSLIVLSLLKLFPFCGCGPEVGEGDRLPVKEIPFPVDEEPPWPDFVMAIWGNSGLAIRDEAKEGSATRIPEPEIAMATNLSNCLENQLWITAAVNKQLFSSN